MILYSSLEKGRGEPSYNILFYDVLVEINKYKLPWDQKTAPCAPPFGIRSPVP
jgi:hypothetical protein